MIFIMHKRIYFLAFPFGNKKELNENANILQLF